MIGLSWVIEDYMEMMGATQKSNRGKVWQEKWKVKNSATLKTTCSVLCKDEVLLKLEWYTKHVLSVIIPGSR